MAQAEIILCDIRREHDIAVERGHAQSSDFPKAPNINYQWLRQWRAYYKISWRAVSLRLKCSKEVLCKRLLAFWCNVLRLRFLLDFLYKYGHSKVPILPFWINCDEKPLWFTSAAMYKTLAPTGAREVTVKENYQKTRERFTAKTRTAYPCLPDDGKQIGCLFRSTTGTRVRKKLEPPNGCYLQFGPKGSYRDEQNCDFWEWAIPPRDELRQAVKKRRCNEEGDAAANSHGDAAACSNDAATSHVAASSQFDEPFLPIAICLSDWAAFNKMDSMIDLVHRMGGMHLNIPGLITGFVQPCDITLHGPMQAHYSRQEQEYALVHLRQGLGMPSVTRQTVMERAVSAYDRCDHTYATTGFLKGGIANALDGSEDNLLSKEVQPWWQQLRMSEEREKLKMEIEAEVKANHITSEAQYRDVLVDYDNHRGEEEGEECITWDPVTDDEISVHSDEDANADVDADCF